MAIYSTFFLSTSEQLAAAFRDWKPPLPEPITRQIRNPFTGEEETVTTCVPDWDDEADAEFDLPEYRVVQIEGRYEDYLESRLHPHVAQQPHWCSKGIMGLELEELFTLMAGHKTHLETPLYGPPTVSSSLQELPDGQIRTLVDADEAEVERLADGWAKVMSTPEHTHSANGERLYEGWTTATAMSLMQPLIDLAKRGEQGDSVYLMIEA